jgi:hypothetical protein
MVVELYVPDSYVPMVLRPVLVTQTMEHASLACNVSQLRTTFKMTSPELVLGVLRELLMVTYGLKYSERQLYERARSVCREFMYKTGYDRLTGNTTTIPLEAVVRVSFVDTPEGIRDLIKRVDAKSPRQRQVQTRGVGALVSPSWEKTDDLMFSYRNVAELVKEQKKVGLAMAVATPGISAPVPPSLPRSRKTTSVLSPSSLQASLRSLWPYVSTATKLLRGSGIMDGRGVGGGGGRGEPSLGGVNLKDLGNIVQSVGSASPPSTP